MARHHDVGYVLATQQGTISNGLNFAGDKSTLGEDEALADVDEPPDERTYFSKYSPTGTHLPRFRNNLITTLPCQQYRKPSLLTQALLKNPDPILSDSEAPPLTSDGGMTSPTRTNTPSPPLPEFKDGGIIRTPTKDLTRFNEPTGVRLSQSPLQNEGANPTECSVQAGLGRPRHITFACGGKKPSNPSDNVSSGCKTDTSQPVDPPKRSCKLRFTCPSRPSCTSSRNEEAAIKKSGNKMEPVEPNTKSSTSSSTPLGGSRQHRDLASTITSAKHGNAPRALEDGQSSNMLAHNLKKPKRSEATRFHEFASSFDVEDDWIQEQPPRQEKITVQDTLRKENLIRKLAEEADEEALEDEVERKNDSYDNAERVRLDDEDLESEYGSSDGGNETDDEEGFADSDDDSDHGSQYQFWTSGFTTAATSTDQIEHTRLMTHRVASESSIESMINTLGQPPSQEPGNKRNRKIRHHQQPPKMRPGTPDLPDSTDFVCGTLDEDRPIEAAYMSCLEERRRSRHKAIPQDIDPSFPTSDFDEEGGDDDDDPDTQASDEHVWVTGRPDNSDEDYTMSPRKGITRARTKSPMPSPKRARSPAPTRRGLILRSPPPRCLFGRSPVHNRLGFMHQKLRSPPSTRRASITLSPQRHRHMITSHLAQRPDLTHTTSLPRTPNPFWRQHHDSRIYISDEARSMSGSPNTARAKGHGTYRRGPINIVRGLENKKQWRRERCYRQQVRHTGKEKARRCQPGKGAERMRELGLEMAGKGRVYCPKAELVLSL